MPHMQTPWVKRLLGPRLLADNGHSKPRMNLVMKRLGMTFSQIKEAAKPMLFKAKHFINTRVFQDLLTVVK